MDAKEPGNKACPKCKNYNYRDLSCINKGKPTNEIRCWNCKELWCWLCGEGNENFCFTSFEFHYAMLSSFGCMTGKTSDIHDGYLYLQTVIAILLFPVFHVICFGLGNWLKLLCSIGEKCSKTCGCCGYLIPFTIGLPWSLLLLEIVLLVTVLTFIPFFIFTIMRICTIYSHSSRKGKIP